MAGSTSKAVGLTALFVQGILVFSPVSESAAHVGHVLVFLVELARVIWENRSSIRRLWATMRCGVTE